MKYNITINQPLMIENKLNVSQWCILDVISVAPLWCEIVTIDKEVYYWVARQKIAEEIRGLNLKPDTIYRYIKQLTELGFIEHLKSGKKDLIRLTSKGKKIFSTMSEKNPNHYVGKKSEFNSEKNPTYNNTILNNKTTNNQTSKTPPRKKPLNFIYPKEFEELWKINRQGDKWNAYKAYYAIKSNYTQEQLKQVLDLEAKKTFGRRHTSTVFNGDLDDALLEEQKEVDWSLIS